MTCRPLSDRTAIPFTLFHSGRARSAPTGFSAQPSNMFFADVIFPAFSAPYISCFFFPAAAAAAIFSEFIVFKLRYKSIPWPRLAFITLIANLCSWFLGVALSLVLPSGLIPKAIPNRGNPISIITQGPHFDRLLIYGFILAFLLSIFVEYFVWRAFQRSNPVRGLFATCTLANIASYSILVGISYSYIHFGWW